MAAGGAYGPGAATPEGPGRVGTVVDCATSSRFPVGLSCQDTSVSGLWTPSGADLPEDTGDAAPEGSVPEPSPEELSALREVHARLVATPVVDVIVNHALG